MSELNMVRTSGFHFTKLDQIARTIEAARLTESVTTLDDVVDGIKESIQRGYDIEPPPIATPDWTPFSPCDKGTWPEKENSIHPVIVEVNGGLVQSSAHYLKRGNWTMAGGKVIAYFIPPPYKEKK